VSPVIDTTPTSKDVNVLLDASFSVTTDPLILDVNNGLAESLNILKYCPCVQR